MTRARPTSPAAPGGPLEARRLPTTEERLFLWLLLAPAVASLLRKLLPGQEAWVEAVPCILPVSWYLVRRRRGPRLPTWVAAPVLALVGLQLLYALLSVATDWRVGGIAIILRVLPMTLVPIAFRSCARREWLEKTCLALSLLAVLNLLLSVAGFVTEHPLVEKMTRPLASVIDAGKSVRSGVRAASGLFSTPWLAGLGMLSAAYWAMASLSQGGRKSRMRKLLVWSGVLAGLAVTYLSTRRAAFLLAAAGLVAMVLVNRSLKVWKSLLLAAAVIAASAYLDRIGVAEERSGSYRDRMEFLLDNPAEGRMRGVFFPWVSYWLDRAPFGSFLGFAGPEGRALGVVPSLQVFIVEVGAALLAAEGGWVAVLLWPCAVLFMCGNALLRTWRAPGRPAAILLVMFVAGYFSLFYFKELLALANPSLGQFLFWAGIGLLARITVGFAPEAGAPAPPTPPAPPRRRPPIGASGQVRRV